MRKYIIVAGVEKLPITGKELLYPTQHEELTLFLQRHEYTNMDHEAMFPFYLPKNVTSNKIFVYSFDSDDQLTDDPREAPMLADHFKQYFSSLV